jgi:hypothetical protein
MNCSYHHERTSIGLCRFCMRGLCAACAADFEAGLACKGRHEEAVARLVGSVAAASRITRVAPLVFVALGLLFGVWGYLSSHTFLDFSVLTGACLVFFGLAAFRRRGSASKTRTTG